MSRPLFVLVNDTGEEERRDRIRRAVAATNAFLVPLPFGEGAIPTLERARALAPGGALMRLGLQGAPFAADAGYPTIRVPVAFRHRSRETLFGHIGHPAWLAAWRAHLTRLAGYVEREGLGDRLHGVKICPFPPDVHDMEFGTFWYDPETETDSSAAWTAMGFTNASLPDFMEAAFAVAAEQFPRGPISLSFLRPHTLTYGRRHDPKATLATAILRRMKAREAYDGQLVVMNLTVGAEDEATSWAQTTAHALRLGFAAQLGTQARAPAEIAAAATRLAALDPLWGEAHPFDLPAALAPWEAHPTHGFWHRLFG